MIVLFSVNIAEGGNRKVLPYVKNCLKKASREGAIDAALCAGRADLLIVPRGAEPRAEADYLLLAGGQQPRPGDRALRCGLGGGDALTLSSIGEDRAMLALQASIHTLNGAVLEPQEIPVALAAPAEPEAVLAAASAMLLLGADAQQGLKL